MANVCTAQNTKVDKLFLVMGSFSIQKDLFGGIKANMVTRKDEG